MWVADGLDVAGAGAGGTVCGAGGMTMVGAADAPVCVVCTDGTGGADTPPPTPNGIVGAPFVGLALVLRPAKSGRLVVKDGWFV